jgi:hypothetical protein
MNLALDALARKFPSTKFVKIISTECVEGYEDHLLPTLLVYNRDTLSALLSAPLRARRRATACLRPLYVAALTSNSRIYEKFRARLCLPCAVMSLSVVKQLVQDKMYGGPKLCADAVEWVLGARRRLTPFRPPTHRGAE